MKLTSLSEIQEYVEKENHKKYFSVYCCLPLYFYMCIFDLNFYKNSTHYAKSLSCGFKK